MISFQFFLDSGAHSLYNKYAMHKKIDPFSFYDSKEFYTYVDEYSKFIIKNKKKFSVYVNVDVIFNPEKTFEIHEYMEKKWGLRPLPVVHYGESGYYIDKYIKKKYDYIGIGGLGQKVHRNEYYDWADEIFTDHICDAQGYPKVKTHGFAMTSFDLMYRYPWYSVDSSSFIKNAVFGILFFPGFDWKKNDFDYTKKFMRIRISNRESAACFSYDYFRLKPMLKEKIDLFIEKNGFVVGKSVFNKNGEEKIIQEGLVNSIEYRTQFNADYFLTLAKSMPEYPRKFMVERNRINRFQLKKDLT